jgi:hypothetical protein
MSDSPNRAVDFGAGVIVGILLAVGIGGAYMFAQVREQQMRAMMEADRAREAEMRAREEAEVAAHRAREIEHHSRNVRAGAEKTKEAPEMPPAKDPE